MKSISVTVVFIVLAGLISIQFAAVIDDPHHLAKPDTDCPICLAANTQVCIPPHVSIDFTPNIIFYLVEKPPFDQQKEVYLTTLSIRGPPHY